jgi:hypothetical protein
MRKYIPEGSREEDQMFTCETVIVNPDNFEIISKCPLMTKKNLKGLQLIPCKQTNTAIINFTSKEIAVQNMSDLTLLSKVTFLNPAGFLSTPFTQSGIGYLIPAPKHFMKIDYSKFLASP